MKNNEKQNKKSKLKYKKKYKMNIIYLYLLIFIVILVVVYIIKNKSELKTNLIDIWSGNLTKLANENTYWKKIVKTTDNTQIVLMNVLPNDVISMEIHPDNDQFIYITEGSCDVTTNNKKYQLSVGDSILIPKNTYHEVQNKNNTNLKLFTIYTPKHMLYDQEKNDL